MNILKRAANLWKLSGIEVGDIGTKAEVVDKMAEIFKKPTIKQEKKLATIIKAHEMPE